MNSKNHSLLTTSLSEKNKNNAKIFLAEDKKEINFCRICNSRKLKDLGVIKEFTLSILSVEILMPYSICLKCKFIFQKYYLGDRFINLYYKNSPNLRISKISNNEKKQYRRQIDFLKKNININKITSLEIGAHTGYFLEYMFKNFQNKCYFDELSEEALIILNNNKNLKAFDYKSKIKVDLCIIRHVLEHIYDLQSFVSNVKKCIKKSGFLFIEVPDWSSLDDNTDPFLFEHINQFNSTGLINFMKKNGFDLIAFEKSINKDDPTTPNRVMRLIFSISEIPKERSSWFNYYNNFFQNEHEYWKKNIKEFLSKSSKESSIAFTPASHLTAELLKEINLDDFNIIGFFDIDKKKNRYADKRV